MKYFTYTKKISSAEIDDIMSAAMQGMTYWADSVKANHNDVKGAEYMSDALSRGAELLIHDSEEKTYKLTVDMLVDALSKTDNTDFESYDMYDAERLVQMSIFGKLVYG